MRNKLYYENRIAILTAKGEMKNAKLIAKVKRKLRQLENLTWKIKKFLL